MGNNSAYYQQIRARGLCVLCRRPMDDDDPKQAHRECYRAQNQGQREAEIRANPPALERKTP